MTVRHWLIITTVLGQLIGVAMVGAAPRPRSPSPAIAFMQLSLRVVGYDPGVIDGVNGRQTISALTAYAQDRRIVLNRATADLVGTLLAAEAVQTLRQLQPEEELLGARELEMLPVYQW
jgi:hypothetical protein